MSTGYTFALVAAAIAWLVVSLLVIAEWTRERDRRRRRPGYISAFGVRPAGQARSADVRREMPGLRGVPPRPGIPPSADPVEGRAEAPRPRGVRADGGDPARARGAS